MQVPSASTFGCLIQMSQAIVCCLAFLWSETGLVVQDLEHYRGNDDHRSKDISCQIVYHKGEMMTIAAKTSVVSKLCIRDMCDGAGCCAAVPDCLGSSLVCA